MDTTTKNKFIALSKQTKEKNVPEGYVYVGHGIPKSGLGFGYKLMASDTEGWTVNDSSYKGTSIELEYAAPIKIWEKVVGVSFGTFKIKTLCSLELATYCEQICKQKNISFAYNPKVLSAYRYLTFDTAELNAYPEKDCGDFEELTPGQFIDHLLAYEVERREEIAGICDYPIILTKDGIECEKVKISFEEFEELNDAVKNWKEQNIKTPYSKVLHDFFYAHGKLKGLLGRASSFFIWDGFDIGIMKKDSQFVKVYETVSIGTFIDAVNLNEYSFGPHKFTVRKDEVVIGCQEISKEKWATLAARIDTFRKNL